MLENFLNNFIFQKKMWFFILLSITLIFLWKNADIAIMIFSAVILATGLNPVVDKLEKKITRPLATTLVLLGFLLIIAIFILPIFYLSVYEIVEFAKAFPEYITNINHVIENMPLLKLIGITHLNIDFLTQAFTNSTTNVFESVMKFISETSAALLYIFTAIVLMFFFMVDKDSIKKNIIKLFPCEYREKTEQILNILNEKLSGYVFAQTLVSGSVWVTMTIGLLIFKIKYAFLLGVIAGILSIIPLIGSGISLLICLIATYQMGIKYLVIVTVLYTISHFLENHVVRPYVYSKFLDLHQIIIFLALIIGAKYFGVLGIIIAPPFAMALYVLLEELYVKKMDENTIKKQDSDMPNNT